MATNMVQSWYDFPVMSPLDVRNVVANSNLGAAQGAFKRSSTFLQAGWVASTWLFTGVASCVSLHLDDQLAVNDAAQWTFSHQIVNTAASLPIPLRKVMFMRGGTQWEMDIQIDFGPDTYSDVQLSLRDNGGTSGDFQDATAGTIPVVFFAGNFTGIQNFRVTIPQFGRISAAFVAKDNYTAQYSMFEMEWVIQR